MANPPTPRAIRNPKTRFNWRVSDFIRRMMVWWFELRARITGRGYYCSALAGESDYNITVNSDQTVSCSCQDYDGSGHIGDLRKNTFEEVYFGPVAQRFRDELARGKIPIPTCARCCDFRRLPQKGVQPPVRLPYRGMLLENTVVCNVDCVGCAREGAASIRTGKQMSLADLGRMGDLAARLKMEKLFYLNLGEPFLSPTICQELPMLRAKLPDCCIVVATNGILLNTDAKREAALSISIIRLSLHGISDAMVEKYMLRGSFEKAYAAMKEMVAYRDARGLRQPVMEWKYLLFNWNDHPKTIQRAIELAKAANVDIITFAPTHNPFYGMSWRYHLGLMNHIGRTSWKGREVVLRPENYAS
jgi:uncharacterized Fe-S cluster-containing radical SAM superfamily protein